MCITQVDGGWRISFFLWKQAGNTALKMFKTERWFIGMAVPWIHFRMSRHPSIVHILPWKTHHHAPCLPSSCSTTLLGRCSAITHKETFQMFSASGLMRNRYYWASGVSSPSDSSCWKWGTYWTAVQQLYRALLRQSCSYSSMAKEVEWLHMTLCKHASYTSDNRHQSLWPLWLGKEYVKFASHEECSVPPCC